MTSHGGGTKPGGSSGGSVLNTGTSLVSTSTSPPVSPSPAAARTAVAARPNKTLRIASASPSLASRAAVAPAKAIAPAAAAPASPASKMPSPRSHPAPAKRTRFLAMGATTTELQVITPPASPAAAAKAALQVPASPEGKPQKRQKSAAAPAGAATKPERKPGFKPAQLTSSDEDENADASRDGGGNGNDVSVSVNVKRQPPPSKSKRLANSPRFYCPVKGCYHVLGFPYPGNLKKHISQIHGKLSETKANELFELARVRTKAQRDARGRRPRVAAAMVVAAAEAAAVVVPAAAPTDNDHTETDSDAGKSHSEAEQEAAAAASPTSDSVKGQSDESDENELLLDRGLRAQRARSELKFAARSEAISSLPERDFDHSFQPPAAVATKTLASAKAMAVRDPKPPGLPLSVAVSTSVLPTPPVVRPASPPPPALAAPAVSVSAITPTLLAPASVPKQPAMATSKPSNEGGNFPSLLQRHLDRKHTKEEKKANKLVLREEAEVPAESRVRMEPDAAAKTKRQTRTSLAAVPQQQQSQPQTETNSPHAPPQLPVPPIAIDVRSISTPPTAAMIGDTLPLLPLSVTKTENERRCREKEAQELMSILPLPRELAPRPPKSFGAVSKRRKLEVEQSKHDSQPLLPPSALLANESAGIKLTAEQPLISGAVKREETASTGSGGGETLMPSLATGAMVSSASFHFRCPVQRCAHTDRFRNVFMRHINKHKRLNQIDALWEAPAQPDYAMSPDAISRRKRLQPVAASVVSASTRRNSTDESISTDAAAAAAAVGMASLAAAAAAAPSASIDAGPPEVLIRVEGPKILRCLHCPKTYRQQKSFDRHVAAHAKSTESADESGSTPDETGTESETEKAQTTRPVGRPTTREKTFACQIAGCTKAYAISKSLNRHLRVDHKMKQKESPAAAAAPAQPPASSSDESAAGTVPPTLDLAAQPVLTEKGAPARKRKAELPPDASGSASEEPSTAEPQIGQPPPSSPPVPVTPGSEVEQPPAAAAATAMATTKRTHSKAEENKKSIRPYHRIVGFRSLLPLPYARTKARVRNFSLTPKAVLRSFAKKNQTESATDTPSQLQLQLITPAASSSAAASGGGGGGSGGHTTQITNHFGWSPVPFSYNSYSNPVPVIDFQSLTALTTMQVAKLIQMNSSGGGGGGGESSVPTSSTPPPVGGGIGPLLPRSDSFGGAFPASTPNLRIDHTPGFGHRYASTTTTATPPPQFHFPASMSASSSAAAAAATAAPIHHPVTPAPNEQNITFQFAGPNSPHHTSFTGAAALPMPPPPVPMAPVAAAPNFNPAEVAAAAAALYRRESIAPPPPSLPPQLIQFASQQQRANVLSAARFGMAAPATGIRRLTHASSNEASVPSSTGTLRVADAGETLRCPFRRCNAVFGTIAEMNAHTVTHNE